MPAGENSVKLATPLLALLSAGKLLLTPNQRAARVLRRGFDTAMQAEGQRQWAPANVLPLDTWLDSLWRQLLLNGDETRLLLNRTQEHTLWREIVAPDPEVSGLRSIDQLAEMAAQAWSALCRHNGRGRLRELGTSTDTRAFQRWAQEFERRTQRSGYLSAARLPEALTQALAEATLPLPATGISLVDFDQLPPALDDLFDQIDRAGYPVTRLQTTQPSTRHLVTAPDDAAELQTAAHWCRERLAQDHSCRIAVVVPALADRRHALERTFAQILTPEAQPITAPPQPPIFEFSLGRPLAQTAPLTAALDLLRWTFKPLPLEAISSLLLSPFFGAAGPAALAAADFDVHTLRRAQLLRPELSLDAFLDLAANRLPPSLLAQLHALHRAAHSEHVDDPAAQQPHEAWSDAFRLLLESAGWTAATARDSLSWQTRQRWESALDELATLDFDAARPTAADALAQLTRIAGQTIFAPESGDAPIQILGPLELGGVPFDHLWFLAADDLSWPIPPATSPLLPWAVQQSLGLPGADAARDRRHAQTLTDRIAASAAEVVFSYAQHADDGIRRPSPLLAPLNLTLLAVAPQPPPGDPIPLLHHPDTLPIAPLPAEVIHGGASILQAQAACAFRAFAEKRLRSGEPESTEPGLNPQQRGQIVHDVMELFWAELEHQDALLALTPQHRDDLLNACIDEALRKTAARARTSKSAWEEAYVEVQRARLRQLLRPWLDVEAARPPFAVTAHEREDKDLTIGPLHLTVRIDRVDETEAGPLILDYKTGSASPAEWLTDRPDQPQIPLYAVLAGTPPAGVAFALLRPGKDLGLCGFADDTTVLAKPSRMQLSMPAQVAEWRRILEALATAFANGEATVAPKCYPKTCQYCTQRILCRLDVTTLDDAGDETAEQEGEPTYG